MQSKDGWKSFASSGSFSSKVVPSLYFEMVPFVLCISHFSIFPCASFFSQKKFVDCLMKRSGIISLSQSIVSKYLGLFYHYVINIFIFQFQVRNQHHEMELVQEIGKITRSTTWGKNAVLPLPGEQHARSICSCGCRWERNRDRVLIEANNSGIKAS